MFGRAEGQSLSNRGLLLDALCLSKGEHSACDRCRGHGSCRINEKTDEQLDYIFSSIEESTFLKACPGSGKTEVVAMKAAHEILNWNKNGGIAILSFTNNAADVITDRVSEITGLKSVTHPHFIGTFDSWLHTYIAHPFLFHYSKYKGDEKHDLDLSFKLIDPSSEAGFLNSFKTRYQYNRTGTPFANQYYFEISEEDCWFSSGKRSLDTVRNNMTLEDWRKEELRTTKEAFWEKGFANYQDVEFLSQKLLGQEKNLCKLLAKRFPFIIIDEAQDLSAVQLRIIECLRQECSIIHLVGDLDQAIYDFKKVDPSLVEDFVRENSMTEMKLTNNFRSNQSIVDFNQNIIPSAHGVMGNDKVTNFPCVFVSYPKKEMAKLSVWFVNHIAKFQDVDIQKSIIVARGKGTISKLCPSTSNGLKLPHELALAIKLWSEKNDHSLHEAILLMGKCIANKFLGEYSAAPSQYYKPEIVSTVSGWRSCIANILDEFLMVEGVIDFDKVWSDWAKLVKEELPNVAQNHIGNLEFSERNYVFILPDKFAFKSPNGDSANKVINTIKYTAVGSSQIKVKTIHAVKGQTLEAVMVVSAKSKGGPKKDGHWEEWLIDQDSEAARLAYVASSRPKMILVWAVPEADAVQRKRLCDLGLQPVEWEVA